MEEKPCSLDKQHHFVAGQVVAMPCSPNGMATIFADQMFYALGFGQVKTLEAAERIGKAILHTAMNVSLKVSKGE